MTSIRNPWTYLTAGIVASLMICSIAAPLEASILDTAVTLLRSTGRYAFFLFLVIFLASSLHKVFNTPLTATLLSKRGGFGLMLAGNQIVHLVLIFIAFELSPTPLLSPPLVLGGSLGMVLIFAMALTSFRQVASALPTSLVKAIHLSGTGYLLFIVFFYDIIVSIVTKQPMALYIILGALYYAAMMFRVGVYLRSRKEATP